MGGAGVRSGRVPSWTSLHKRGPVCTQSQEASSIALSEIRVLEVPRAFPPQTSPTGDYDGPGGRDRPLSPPRAREVGTDLTSKTQPVAFPSTSPTDVKEDFGEEPRVTVIGGQSKHNHEMVGFWWTIVNRYRYVPTG